MSKAATCDTNILHITRGSRSSRRRFLARDDGAAGLEFAFVVMPFLLLLMGVIEVGLAMFVSTQLQGATAEAARQIRTGSVQGAADPVTAFRDLLCDGLVAATACDDRLVMDVRAYDSFGDVVFPSFYNAAGQAEGTEFSAGGAGQTVLVRVAYNWTIQTPFLATFLANDGDDGRIMNAATVFRNEPFDGGLQQ